MRRTPEMRAGRGKQGTHKRRARSAWSMAPDRRRRCNWPPSSCEFSTHPVGVRHQGERDSLRGKDLERGAVGYEHALGASESPTCGVDVPRARLLALGEWQRAPVVNARTVSGIDRPYRVSAQQTK